MSKLMLAVWPNRNPMQYWGYSDDCTSIWLYFRQIEGDGYMETSTTAAEIAGDLGLWVWAAKPYTGSTLGSACVEFKAHEVYSAGSAHLRKLAATLDRFQKKVVDIPESFGMREQIILALQKVGVRDAVVVSTPNKIVSVEEALSMGKYGIAIEKMQEMRRTGRHVA